ncbi:MAG: protein arginine kinase [Candidatus Eisenbacteria bacterium]|uniref:Protein arginine kinase n=1 Tax=Eiseniibacteriota bacterium TaxID=2212470 RepID=A0A948RXX7_UNCEI|nr:protein arginine kinase [Candidatus Eisenbacteria bacterium]MBU1949830.1 protein arginine kinase [Candidatus Eisenbacteria bacterium]MBU2690274.1 protein arginine kinase [Candidatus Eisenbacteria bacterium]
MSFGVSDLLERSASWTNAQGPMSDRILSSRIRLARNIKGIRFITQAGEDELRTVLSRLRMALEGIPELEGGYLALMEDLSLMERQFLFERHLVSHDMTVGAPQQAVFLEPEEVFGIMVNEEDHLRLQTLASGFQLQESFEKLNQLDDHLAERLEYAFNSELGYQTSCPTNVGTGLRASVLIHLPSLVLTKKIRKVLAGVHQVGLSVRGFWGEGSDVVGNFFQISNQVTLGEREAQTLRNLDRVIRQVLEYEEKARDVLIREARMEVEDKIGRAHGTLCHARVLTSQEMIGLLSAVRFGVTLEMADMPGLQGLNELLILGQPAHIQLRIGREMSSIERNRFRADLVRERMKEAMREMAGPGGRSRAPDKGEEL